MDATPILLALLPSVATGIAGYLAAMVRRRSKEEQATTKIIRALGRKEIMDAYQSYIVAGHHKTVERFEQLTVLSIAPLLARAIHEVFEDGSVTSLFN